MKIALVHDDLIQQGGAEAMFAAMREIWPEADVYTALTGKEQMASARTSFMQKIPFANRLYWYRALLPLYPLAFESFDLSNYDVVISSSSRFAHGVITRPETLHVWYCYSPSRYAWLQSHAAWLQSIIAVMRQWDLVAAHRPDQIVAISQHVAKQVNHIYRRPVAAVVYPFVDSEKFRQSVSQPDNLPKAVSQKPYFLIVTRQVAWKKVDIAVEACNQLKVPLVIVGDGPDKQRLQNMAGSTVALLGHLTDRELVWYYQHCQAFLMTQEEDFGIAALEAQAAGKPVIAYQGGGAKETVIDGQTGSFFYPQTAEALAAALKNFQASQWSAEACQANAQRFRKSSFMTQLKKFVEDAWQKQQKTRN